MALENEGRPIFATPPAKPEEAKRKGPQVHWQTAYLAFEELFKLGLDPKVVRKIVRGEISKDKLQQVVNLLSDTH